MLLLGTHSTITRWGQTHAHATTAPTATAYKPQCSAEQSLCATRTRSCNELCGKCVTEHTYACVECAATTGTWRSSQTQRRCPHTMLQPPATQRTSQRNKQAATSLVLCETEGPLPLRCLVCGTAQLHNAHQQLRLIRTSKLLMLPRAPARYASTCLAATRFAGEQRYCLLLCRGARV